MATKLIRIVDGIMEAAWLAALVISPVFFNVFSSRIFEPDKITAIRSIALLVLAAWIVKLVEQRHIRWTKFEAGKNIFVTIWETPLLLPVTLMALSYLVATVFSVSWATSLYGSYQRLQGTYTFFSYVIIFAAIAANMRKRTQVDRLILTVILASLPVSLYGILQRFQLDPIPWGGNTTIRVASNMGNSIFVAAYLIMVVPFALAKVISSFQAIWNESTRQILHVVKASLYLFILILQLVTIYLSGSRGPMLGLMAGIYFMALLLTLVWRKRALTYIVLVASLLVGAFLVTLNIDNGPLEAVRKSALVGRFGSLLDTESNTAKVRYYIWLGASKLVMPHEPLEYPDGSLDQFNFLRPIIGYGPESMYVAYNPFYEPMLGHVERRNASPDRSHNETWDSLVTMGLFGFLTYIAVFAASIYFGLRWLGMIENRVQQILFWGLVSAGGVAGSIAVILWNGLPYLGVGLPIGLIVGVLVYIALAAVSGKYRAPVNASESARSLVLIALVAAIIAHWVEINFGIAIVSTRVHFWVYIGLLFVVGLALPRHGEYDVVETSEQIEDHPRLEEATRSNQTGGETKGKSSAKRGVRKAPAGRIPQSAPGLFSQPWLMAALTNGFLLAFIMVSLCYDYITNPTRSVHSAEIITRSFTYLSTLGDAPSFALVGLLFVTLAAGALLFPAEDERVRTVRTWLLSAAVSAGVALTAMVLYSFGHAGRLAALASAVIESEAQLFEQVSSLGGLLTIYYVFIFMLIAGAAFFLYPRSERLPFTSGLGIIVGPILLLVMFVTVMLTNLQVIHADVAFKMAEPFTTGTQWPIATRLYDQALSLAPNEDYYYLFLGRSYLEQAKQLTTEAEQSAVVAQAENDLKAAQKINPLNTDHTANLARLYSWWASKTNDAQKRLERGQISADYYARATVLSRNSAALWAESAVVYLNILNQPDEAKRLLEKALALDADYPFVQSLMGDYYLSVGRTQVVPELKVENMEKAITYYEKAIETSVGRDAGNQLNYSIAVGNVYLELASINPENLDKERLSQAATAFLSTRNFAINAQDITKIEEQLGRIYIQLGDKASALSHLQQSLAAASATADKDRLQQLINQVNTMP